MQIQEEEKSTIHQNKLTFERELLDVGLEKRLELCRAAHDACSRHPRRPHARARKAMRRRSIGVISSNDKERLQTLQIVEKREAFLVRHRRELRGCFRLRCSGNANKQTIVTESSGSTPSSLITRHVYGFVLPKWSAQSSFNDVDSFWLGLGSQPH